MTAIDLTRPDLVAIREAYAAGGVSQRTLCERYGLSSMTLRKVLRGQEPYLRERIEAAFWARVDRSGGPDACWPWTGRQNENGYGRWHYERQHMAAHRVAWLWTGRSLTPGLELDHLCRNRLCVNVSHLEEVTHRENVMRGTSVAVANAAKTHCPQGHAYDEENTIVTADGRRLCRQCQRDHKKAWVLRRRAG